MTNPPDILRRRLVAALLALGILATAWPAATAAVEPDPGPSTTPTAVESGPGPLEATPDPASADPTTTPPVPTPTPTASPAPTASPSPTPAPTVSPPIALSGYRWTTRGVQVWSSPSTSSTSLFSLDRDTRVTAIERVSVGGTRWAKVSSAGRVGYLRYDALAEHSALASFVVRRATRRPTAFYAGVNDWSEPVASLWSGTVFETTQSALDSRGRRWVLAHATVGSTTVEGYLPYWHAGTIAVSVSGTWTVVRETTHHRYAYAGWDLRSLPEGTRVTRSRSLTDTWGASWTYVRTAAGEGGWVRSSSLSGPYRQFIWNRRNPVTQQYTNYWCVPASVQTELNIALDRYSTSYAFQQRVYVYGRANLGYQIQAIGLDPQSWARALGYFSGDRTPYLDATFSTYTAAIKAGAKQMRETRQPVGLLVYYGGHAWTMIGYTATADPGKTDFFDVTGVYVAAPFVRWTDPPAGTYYSDAAFRRKMTPYWEAERWTRWNGLYTIILPQ
ncbi:MAG TPA: hypothetical protein VGQ47_02905 [Candidatus Limnocylindrales bacterium]|nr:hypothetical protein [Candidatus Limnocylindrales bacterium]